MLADWLDWQERTSSPYAEFAVVDVQEAASLSPQVKQHLQSLLEHAKLDPAFLEAAASHLGWHRVQSLVAARQPTVQNMRRGTFGEVLVSAMLQQFHDYTIPIQKLQFTISPDQSLPGTDTIALKLDDEERIVEVCFVESKLRTTADTGAALQGYEQLRDDYAKRVPDMLLFVATRLYERQDPLFDEFMTYMRDRAAVEGKDTFRLGLTWEKAAWVETTVQNLEDNGVDLTHLAVHVAKLSDLGQLTSELFGAIGVVEVTDES